MEYNYLRTKYEPEDSIADSVRIFSGRGGGIGEGFGDGVILSTRRKLYEESTALAGYIKRMLSEDGESVFLVGGGMYDTAAITVSCSLIGCSLTLCETLPKFAFSCDLLIASHQPIDEHVKYKSFISLSELNAVILGELACDADVKNITIGSGFSVVFLGERDDEIESYNEQMAVRIARRYAKAEGIFPWDTCFSTIHPCSREGFFGGLLAPMLYAKKWFYCSDFGNAFEEMKLSSPTKIVCEPKFAEELMNEMEKLKSLPSFWKKGVGSHPLRLKLDKLFPRTRAAIRRLKMIYVHYHFGGRISGVATIGELNEKTSESLASFGVLSSSLLGIKNCALVGFRRYGDKRNFWRLPEGLFADMCNVGGGGLGRVTFFGDGISLGEARGHTFKAGELRSEYNVEPILVSNICGFSASGDVFYAKKQSFL